MNETLLLFALNIIKQECKLHDGCDNECPLYDRKYHECTLHEQPDSWLIDADKPCERQLIF